jgi:hypothetical protein
MSISKENLALLAQVAAGAQRQADNLAKLVEMYSAKAPRVRKPRTVEQDVTPVVVPIDLNDDEDELLVVEVRANNRLTAKSAKAINAALAGTINEIAINGNSEAELAIYALEETEIPFRVVQLGIRQETAEVTNTETSTEVKGGTAAEKKLGNRRLADWLISEQVVARGDAWTAAKSGERSVRKLKALNTANGLVFKVSAPKVAIAVDADGPAKTARQAAIAVLVKAGFSEAEATGYVAEVQAV